LTKKAFLFKTSEMDEKPSKIYLRTRWVPGTFKEHEKEADLNRKKGILKVLIVDA
jgi:hypothetical protein